MDIVELLEAMGIEAMEVTIEPYAGPTSSGHRYDPPQLVTPCWVDGKRRLVRDATGAQVVSSTTVYAALATVCPPRSRVHLPDGRTTYAITVGTMDGGGLDVPEHVEISCE